MRRMHFLSKRIQMKNPPNVTTATLLVFQRDEPCKTAFKDGDRNLSLGGNCPKTEAYNTLHLSAADAPYQGLIRHFKPSERVAGQCSASCSIYEESKWDIQTQIWSFLASPQELVQLKKRWG